MKCCPAILVLSALLGATLPCAAQVHPQTQNPIPGSDELTANASITVSVRDDQGRPISSNVYVTLTSADDAGPITEVLPHVTGREWVFTNLVPGAQYVVIVRAPGFTTARQFVEMAPIPNASARLDFFLVPESEAKGLAKPAGTAILAPHAQKEVQQGIKDLQANKIESAQKHLANALKMAPGNPLVNYLVGESWLRAGNVDEATRYLENAISLDPKQTQALVALGRLRYEHGDIAKAIELLKQAVESAPESWEAHWLLAAAYLRARNYPQAKEQAESALKYGKNQADPATVIVGLALANLGKRDQALSVLSDYLKRHPDDRRAEQVRALIANSQQTRKAAPPAEAAEEQPQAGAGVRTIAGNTNAPAPRSPEPRPRAELAAKPAAADIAPTPSPLAAVPAKESWMPADVDEEKPEKISNAACQLPQIMEQAARHAEELVTDLEKYSATEDFQEVEINRDGELRRPLAQTFSFLVFIEHIRPHVISIREMRTPDPASRKSKDLLISSGLTALALAFHPDLSGDFDWKCEGMGEWKGQPAWLIHFQQRPDRPTSRLHGFRNGMSGGPVPVKGRAWVAANGDHVLHLETDLVNPLEQMRLEREHFAIDYGLVRFRTHPVSLWLPESVDAYFSVRGHSYHQYSRFSNFELFWVGTEQKIAEPKQKEPKP